MYYTVIIWFCARGAYLLLVGKGRVLIWNRAVIRDRALFFFLRTNRMCKTKLSIDIYLERIKNVVVPTSFKEQRAKQTRQTFYSFEGTSHSHGHNSWETERKLTVFVMKPHLKNKTKMNHGWSQCTCTLTVLSLKRNRGAYCNETACWNKGASKEKKQIRVGRLLKRRRLLSIVLNILLFNRVSSRFEKSNCLEINILRVSLSWYLIYSIDHHGVY